MDPIDRMERHQREAILSGVCLIAAVVLGLCAGWVDFHNNEPQPAALLLLIFGFLLGCIQPRSAWRWGILLGMGLPATYIIAHSFGLKPVEPLQPNVLAGLLAILPATIGAYVGAAIRKLITPVLSK